MSLHIGARPGEFAETVLMPGDPLRAKWAAETFLDAPRPVNKLRGMLGYTGTWRGHSVSIQASGMGMASMAIYAHELIRDFGARRLIRIGSCGALLPRMKLHHLVLAMTASSVSLPSRAVLGGINYAPCADFGLLRAAWEAARAHGGLITHTGAVFSSDSFYDEGPELRDTLSGLGVLAVEMETAELYTIAARHGVRALALLTVSDQLCTGEALPPQEREQGLRAMVEVALEAAFAPEPAAPGT